MRVDEVTSVAGEASEIVDEGMEVARAHAVVGMGGFEQLAAALYRVGARLYLSHKPQSLCRFLLESIDPEQNRGAMPHNMEMLEICSNFIIEARDDFKNERQSATEDEEQQGLDRQIEEVARTEERLLELQLQYYAATPEATRVRADLLAARCDIEASKRCWEEYTLFQPKDTRGWVGFADWHACQGDLRSAVSCYRTALRVIPECFRADRISEDDEQRLQTMAAELAQHLADLRMELPTNPPLTYDALYGVQQAIRSEIERLSLDRSELPPTSAYDPVRCGIDGVKSKLEAKVHYWGYRFEEALKQQNQSALDDVRKEYETLQHDLAERAFAVLTSVIASLCASLDRYFDPLAEELRHALGEIGPLIQAQLSRDERERAPAMEGIADALQRAVERVARKYCVDEDPESLRRLVDEVGADVFGWLSQSEQRFLVFAERLLSVKDLDRLAAACYGLTLEQELTEHIFIPVRTRRVQASQGRSTPEQGVAHDGADPYLEKPLEAFLNGQATKMMLGQFVATFCKCILSGSGLDRPVFAEVRSYVQDSFPDSDRIMNLSPEDANRHGRGLQKVVDARNRTMHFREPQRDDEASTLESRNALVGKEGFLRLYVPSRIDRRLLESLRPKP